MQQKRSNGKGGEYNFVTSDKEQKAIFNSYTFDELKTFRTLIKEVGGVEAVAYKLYKYEHGLTDNVKITATFHTVKLISLGDKQEILMPDEIAYAKYIYQKENTGKEFEYEILATDTRTVTVHTYFMKSINRKNQYRQRVNAAFNSNTSGNRHTKTIVKLLQQMAIALNNKKKDQIVRVTNWLSGPPDILKQRKIKEKLETKDALENIKIEDDEN